MATTTVIGYARCALGTQIPLRVDGQAEGTEFSLTTDTNLTVTAQEVGTYKPGATITAIEVFGVNNISYCYVLRNGLILSWGSVNVGGVNNSEMLLCQPVQLIPGDDIRVLTLAAASRNAALCVYTNQGISRIFIGTPAGAATTQLLDLQTGNSIGESLQNQVIVKAMMTTIDGTKVVSSGGAWIRNSSGQLQAAVPASSPVKVEPMISNVQIPISLNWTASMVTNA